MFLFSDRTAGRTLSFCVRSQHEARHFLSSPSPLPMRRDQRRKSGLPFPDSTCFPTRAKRSRRHRIDLFPLRVDMQGIPRIPGYLLFFSLPLFLGPSSHTGTFLLGWSAHSLSRTYESGKNRLSFSRSQGPDDGTGTSSPPFPFLPEGKRNSSLPPSHLFGLPPISFFRGGNRKSPHEPFASQEIHHSYLHFHLPPSLRGVRYDEERSLFPPFRGRPPFFIRFKRNGTDLLFLFPTCDRGTEAPMLSFFSPLAPGSGCSSVSLPRVIFELSSPR